MTATRRIRVPTVLALPVVLLAFAASVPAHAGSAAYLKIDDVKGESDARRAPGGGQIDVQSFSWGASQTGRAAGDPSPSPAGPARAAAARDRGTGLASGRRSMADAPTAAAVAPPAAGGPGEFSFVAAEDATTQRLLRACTAGETIPQATLGADGRTYELADVRVTRCDRSAGTVSFALRAGRVKYGDVTLKR